MGRSAYALLLVTAVVLAGCGSVVTGDAPSTETVTPAPVPTVDERYPPGIDENSVSAETVVATHQAHLAATNYTFRSRQRVTGPNGTMWVKNRTRRVANREGTQWGRIDHREVDFPPGRLSAPIEYWGNESVYASRRILSEQTTFYGWSRTDGMPATVRSYPLLGRTLAATRLTVSDREAGVRLAGSTVHSQGTLPTPPYLRDTRNVSVTVSLARAGRVRWWRLAYDATVENRTVRVRRRARITSVGSTTVTRPRWVDEAREQTQALPGN